MPSNAFSLERLNIAASTTVANLSWVHLAVVLWFSVASEICPGEIFVLDGTYSLTKVVLTLTCPSKHLPLALYPLGPKSVCRSARRRQPGHVFQGPDSINKDTNNSLVLSLSTNGRLYIHLVNFVQPEALSFSSSMHSINLPYRSHLQWQFRPVASTTSYSLAARYPFGFLPVPLPFRRMVTMLPSPAADSSRSLRSMFCLATFLHWGVLVLPDGNPICYCL